MTSDMCVCVCVGGGAGGYVEGSCGHGTGLRRSLQGGEFLDLLSDRELLKNKFAPWNWLSILLVLKIS
jgi:hypothetical protein